MNGTSRTGLIYRVGAARAGMDGNQFRLEIRLTFDDLSPTDTGWHFRLKHHQLFDTEEQVAGFHKAAVAPALAAYKGDGDGFSAWILALAEEKMDCGHPAWLVERRH